ncbi:MAG: hypothetical protein WA921_12090 [Ahrensia sp.]
MDLEKTKNEIGRDSEAQKENARTLTIDYALYAHYLENSDLSDEQKQEFLTTLWNLIVGFVDLGFGVHPLQQADPHPCGQEIDLSGIKSTKVVSSAKPMPRNEFENAASTPNVKPSKSEEK